MGLEGDVEKLAAAELVGKYPSRTPKPRTPQIYRQCWKILKGKVDNCELGFGLVPSWRLISMGDLKDLMDSIERQVRG